MESLAALWEPGTWVAPARLLALPLPPRVRPAALMEVQTFGGGRGCRDCARRFPYRKRALEPIVGPQPPGPPGRSDMAAHRQWAAAPYFKGCPAQSAAPPCEATSAVFMGRGPIFSPLETYSCRALREFKWSHGSPGPLPHPRPLPPYPGPGPGPPLSNVLGPRCNLWAPQSDSFSWKSGGERSEGGCWVGNQDSWAVERVAGG